MLSRRDFLQVALAATALPGLAVGARAGDLARTLREEDLLRFRPEGQVTLLHMTDCHAQLKPIYFREPSINIGVGDVSGLPPHVTGREFLARFGLDAGSYRAYALCSADFEVLAKAWGRVGGLDRVARLVKAIRADRGAANVLFLDGGDALQGSYTAMQSNGADMIRVLEALGVEAMTGHWEFTLGAERVRALFGNKEGGGSCKIPFLAGNVVESDFDEPAFKGTRMFEKGGVKIAVIGQAFPYSGVAHPRWQVEKFAFGIREETVRRQVAAARAGGAQVVVLLSHNGFDVDRKLASRVPGIDVILTGHTHDALPEPVRVGDTLLIASGSHGKFLSRLDLKVEGGKVVSHKYVLIPVLSDVIRPDPEVAKLIGEIRAPHEAMLGTELARAETLLYRRGNFNGTLDDLICQAMLAERDAEIAFSPGFRWGTSIVPGQAITWDDVYNATAMTYPKCYRMQMRGSTIKDILEDVADNLFNSDPYFQQGGDMVRVGGMGFTINVDATMGRRISKMRLLRTGAEIEAGKDYMLAGWASLNAANDGPPIWDVVAAHLQKKKSVAIPEAQNVEVVRG